MQRLRTSLQWNRKFRKERIFLSTGPFVAKSIEYCKLYPLCFSCRTIIILKYLYIILRAFKPVNKGKE